MRNRALDAPDRRLRYEREMQAQEDRRRAREIADAGSDGESPPMAGSPFFIDCPRSGRLVAVGRHVDLAVPRAPVVAPRGVWRHTEDRITADVLPAERFIQHAGLEMDLARRAVQAVHTPGSAPDPRDVELVYTLVRGRLDEARGSVASHAISAALERAQGAYSRRELRFIHDFIREAYAGSSRGPLGPGASQHPSVE